MAKHWVEEIFEKCGAILEGHFVLAFRRHSGKYLDKYMLYYTDPESVCDLCFEIAAEMREKYQDPRKRIEAVVAPAWGGIILSQWIAYFLRTAWQGKVLSLSTGKNEAGNQVLNKRCQKLIAGKSVLIVDDILTTGGTIKEVVKEVHKAGGRIIAVAVICNRGGVTSDQLGFPLFSLWETKIEDWVEEDCPLCEAGIPINEEVGRGGEFVAKKAR